MRIAACLLLSVAFAGLSPAATVPRPSPPFAIQRTDAPPLQIESLRGKIVALVFISTTCPHCQDLTRELAPVVQQYGPRGVQFLECAITDGSKTGVPEFIQQFRPAFPVGYNSQAAVDGYLQRSLIDVRPFYVPHLVLLDRRGVIQGDYAGESDFMTKPIVNITAQLDKLLAEKAAPAKKAPGRKTSKTR